MVEDAKQQGAPTLEWAVGAIGAMLVAATVVFLLFEAWRSDGAPPEVRITAQAPLAQTGGWLVMVRLYNAGGSTAAGVRVEGALEGPDGVAQRSDVTVDYLPPQSAREGGLFFTEDPRRYNLRLRAVGYVRP